MTIYCMIINESILVVIFGCVFYIVMYVVYLSIVPPDHPGVYNSTTKTKKTTTTQSQEETVFIVTQYKPEHLLFQSSRAASS